MCNGEACRYTSGYQAGRCTQSGPPRKPREGVSIEEGEHPVDSNQDKTVADFLTADFENEMQTTLRVLGAVPKGDLDYGPDPKSKTALGLVRHIALEDEWLLNCISNGEFTPPPDDSDACGIMNPAAAVARYKDKVPTALDRVRAMPGEKLTNVIDLLG